MTTWVNHCAQLTGLAALAADSVRSGGFSNNVLQFFCIVAFLVISIAPTYAQSTAAESTAIANAGMRSTAKTWQVGTKRWLRMPSEAAALAKSGDTIEIDAGVYRNDYAIWWQDDLTIRGVGGMAHLESTGLIPNGKAIWIISGNNTVIEDVEFSGARVIDTNGAGIRHQGGNLTLRNTYFHHNEFSVLTGPYPEASLDILSSRFYFQKRKGTFSHGIYVGGLGRFTIIGSHFKGTDRGHQIKSRALENHILYNRIEDIDGGNSSRLVDLPNCGLSYIIGNDMQQAATTENFDAIGYGAEGCETRTEQQHRLFVVNNTFINEAMIATLVTNQAGGDVLVANNLVFGRGYILRGKGVTENNVTISLSDRKPGSWYPPPGSKALNGAQALSDKAGTSLTPTQEFSTPLGIVKRARIGALDVGSRELPETTITIETAR